MRSQVEGPCAPTPVPGGETDSLFQWDNEDELPTPTTVKEFGLVVDVVSVVREHGWRHESDPAGRLGAWEAEKGDEAGLTLSAIDFAVDITNQLDDASWAKLLAAYRRLLAKDLTRARLAEEED